MVKQLEIMSRTWFDRSEAAILSRSLCVLKSKPKCLSRSPCVSIDQCDRLWVHVRIASARRFYRLGEAVLTSTHNLCFGAKIRKNEPSREKTNNVVSEQV